MRGGSRLLNPIERTRLNKLCMNIFSGKLTLITSPAGYGKTWLVDHFMSMHSELLSSYILLDDTDESEKTAEDLLISENGKSDAEQLLIEVYGKAAEKILIEEKAGVEHVLVLDDCYKRDRTWVDMMMRAIVELPLTMHIVMIDRREPSAYCEELAAEGSCLVMNRYDLGFDCDEILRLASANGIHMSRKALDECFELSEGWCLAVCMLLDQYRETGNMSDCPRIITYLRNCMIDRLPSNKREILIMLSAAGIFTRDQAGFITGNSRAYDIIMETRENYGLISVRCENERSAHNHALVGPLLSKAACSAPDAADIVNEGLFKNAVWHESHGDIDSAMADYYRCGRIDSVLRLLDRQDVIQIRIDEKPILCDMLIYLKHIQRKRMREIYATVETTFMFYSENGKYLQGVEKTIEEIDSVQRAAGITFAGGKQLLLAEYYYETGNISRALMLSEEAFSLGSWKHEPVVAIAASYIRSQCLLFMGMNPPGTWRPELIAPESCTEMKKYARTYELSQVLLFGLYQDISYIPDWVREGIMPETGQLVTSSGIYQKALGIGYIRTGHFDRLSYISDAMLARPGQGKYVSRRITAYIFRSIVAWKSAGMDRTKRRNATSYLKKALDIARNDNIQMIFAEFGALLVPILEMITQTQFRDEVLSSCIKYESGQRAFANRKEKVRFTDRERDVVEKLIAGQTNREIALSLNIAIVTVEKNLSAIYKKLGTHNRSAAISKLMNNGSDHI